MIPIALLALAATAGAAEFVDAYAFGLSYHDQPGYNQINPGLGLGIGMRDAQDNEWYVAGGSYRDSFNKTAILALIGARAYGGRLDSWHVSIAGNGGWLKGSGQNALVIIPVGGVGWTYVNLEAAPLPQPGVAACWLRIRIPL